MHVLLFNNEKIYTLIIVNEMVRTSQVYNKHLLHLLII